MRPSSRPASFIMARTLASSVTSQRSAKVRTPKPDKSMTVSRASRAESRKVMATSAPACASASAEARPKRRAAPVTRAVFPRRGLASRSSMQRFYRRAKRRRTAKSRRKTIRWKCQCFRARIRLMPDPRNVVVYSRKGCHLCELVKESLSKLSRRGGFTWKEIDVDGDSELRREFNDQVPVVFIDGRKAFKYRMDEQEFLRKLAS